jgi:DNA processing protein
LLRHGAVLTEIAEDVLAHLGPQLRAEPPRPVRTAPRAATPNWQEPGVMKLIGEAAEFELILERLGPTPVAVDELVRQCQMSAATIAMVLLELELAGRVERHPGNLVSLR